MRAILLSADTDEAAGGELVDEAVGRGVKVEGEVVPLLSGAVHNGQRGTIIASDLDGARAAGRSAAKVINNKGPQADGAIQPGDRGHEDAKDEVVGRVHVHDRARGIRQRAHVHGAAALERGHELAVERNGEAHRPREKRCRHVGYVDR